VLTHLQQVLATGLLLAFGIVALRVWRSVGSVRQDRAALAWGMSAAYFVVSGGYSTAHAVLSAFAQAAGRESALFRWVGSWSIAANLARGTLGMLYVAMLLTLLVLARGWVPRMARRAPLVMTVAAVVFTALARLLPMDTIYWMATGLAVLSMVTALVMMAALLAAVLNDSLDELLWLALALYAFKETLSVSLFAIVAWWSLASDGVAWHLFYAGSVLLAAGMTALAWRRLRLAGQGRTVPALFDHLHALRRSPAS